MRGHERVQLVHRHARVGGLRPSSCALSVSFEGPAAGGSLGDGDRDDLLCEHVKRVARHDGGLDQSFAHAPADDRALEQVAPELGEDPPAC